MSFHFPPNPKLLAATLTVGALLTSGCGRVTPTQSALSSAPLGGKSVAGSSQLKGGVLGKVSLVAGAPGALHGRVLDLSQRPVPGAVVVIAETGQRLTTNASGSFAFSGLPEGNYTFTAMYNGLTQTTPVGVLVAASQDTAVPDITMAPGNGPSGIASITYTQDGAAFGNTAAAPGSLLAPLGIAVRGSDVMVLDVNHSPLVHTGVIRQYGDDGHFVGKFGDYTHWWGFGIMKDTVKGITLDTQGRAWVLDESKLWCFKPDGSKDKSVDLDMADASCISADPTSGALYVAGDSGITKLDGEGGTPQKLANAAGAKAIAAAKDGIWAVADNKVTKLTADGSSTVSFGAGGVDKQDAFQNATALAVDPRNGDLIVVDAGTKNVYVYDSSGAPIGKVGQGVFDNPVALAIDATGRVFVLDAGKKSVYKFLPTAIH